MIKKSLILFALLATPAFAQPAKINNVTVNKTGDTYIFNVTISHPDTGWDHYVDAWQVKDMDGNLLGERKLSHPHVDEQPFTRSLSNVRVPEGVDTVEIIAHDTVSGWGPDTRQVKLP